MTAIENLGTSELSHSNVYTKTEVDDKLAVKAPLISLSVTGAVGSPYLSIAEDATVSANLSVTGTGTVIMARQIQGPPSNNL